MAESNPCSDDLSYDPASFSFNSLQLHQVAWIASGLCAVVATLCSFHLIYKHLTNYNRKREQIHVARILFMVPVFCLTSWLSFRFYHYSVYFDVVRDCYESLVIWSFFSLLIEQLGGPEHAAALFESKPASRLFFPFCCVQYQPRNHILQKLRLGALQYVFVRPISTAIAVVLQSRSEYCSGDLSTDHGYFYLSMINFISVSIAMFALVEFYMIVKEDLAPHKPIPMFLSVKLIIFVSFWQSITIAGLSKFGLFSSNFKYWSSENISVGLQDSLICFEMVIAAIYHPRCFPYEKYIALDRVETKVWSALLHVLDMQDVIYEGLTTIGFKEQRARNRSLRRVLLAGSPTPKQSLIEDGPHEDHDEPASVPVEEPFLESGAAVQTKAYTPL